MLDDFNFRLAGQSAQLICYRAAFVSALARIASLIHSEFSSGCEALTIKYKTVGGLDAFGKKPEQILPELLQHQKDHYQAELKSRQCLSGAHKDDMEVDINGMPARKFGSQGQMRTASVSIKLAEREIHYTDRNEYPILLLDDVLSELDEARQNYILGKIRDGQVIVTCCDNSITASAAPRSVLRVEGGEICTCT